MIDSNVMRKGKVIHAYMDDLKKLTMIKKKNGKESFIGMVKMFNQFTGIEFGIEKCTMFVMKKKKLAIK